MIPHSKAYKIFKEQIQNSIDFVYINCHAVPALKGYIKAVNKNATDKIPDPDYFVPIHSEDNHQRLNTISPKYKKVLGRFLILSSFSYFEAYISNVLTEIFDFHGGQEQLINKATQQRQKTFDYEKAPENKKLIKTLRDRPKPHLTSKYLKLSQELQTKGYKFPSELFSVYGMKILQEKIDNLKAYEILDLLEDALGFDTLQKDKDEFSRIRTLRNDIAHGAISEHDPSSRAIELKEATKDNNFLRRLAARIDEHIVKHFFVIEI